MSQWLSDHIFVLNQLKQYTERKRKTDKGRNIIFLSNKIFQVQHVWVSGIDLDTRLWCLECCENNDFDM